MKNSSNQNGSKVNPLVVGGLAAAGAAAAAVVLSKKENRDKVVHAIDEAKKKGEKLTKEAIKTIENLRDEPIVDAAEKKVKQISAKSKSAARKKN